MSKVQETIAAVTELAQAFETEQEKVAILEGEVARLTNEQATTRELNAELRRLNASLTRNVEQARKELRDIGEERAKDFPLRFTADYTHDIVNMQDLFRVSFNHAVIHRITPTEMAMITRNTECKIAFVDTVAKRMAGELAKSLFASIEKSALENARKNYRASDFF